MFSTKYQHQQVHKRSGVTSTNVLVPWTCKYKHKTRLLFISFAELWKMSPYHFDIYALTFMKMDSIKMIIHQAFIVINWKRSSVLVLSTQVYTCTCVCVRMCVLSALGFWFMPHHKPTILKKSPPTGRLNEKKLVNMYFITLRAAMRRVK